jgi:uncharacterized protein YndB with AHSA1/START domain
VLRIHTTIHRSRLPVPRWERSRVLAALSHLKPYTFHIALAIYWPVLLYADSRAQTLIQQHVLGALTFAFLFLATRFSPPEERRQVWMMVVVATSVELFCSVIWGIYRYRWGNVPLFVPPGHGLLYLFALRAARTPLMATYGRTVGRVALACATIWAIGGLTVGPLITGRVDALGALLWPIFVWLMRKPAAVIYAASFFITAELELLGTGFGTWTWAAAAPVTHLPAGNPPSVIAGGYCLLDAVASKAATLLPAAGVFSRWLPSLKPGQVPSFFIAGGDVSRVCTTVQINTPIERTFDYVTTPGNWPAWHPSSLGVSGATDHSLEPGEQVTEELRVAGRRGRVVWTVRERDVPRRWVIDGRVEGGGGGTIIYTTTPHASGTTFERELVYAMPNRLLALLDRLVLRRRVEAESAEALRRLKTVLEGGGVTTKEVGPS